MVCDVPSSPVQALLFLFNPKKENVVAVGFHELVRHIRQLTDKGRRGWYTKGTRCSDAGRLYFVYAQSLSGQAVGGIRCCVL